MEAVEGDRLLRLRAETKLPGRAWLQFEVSGDRTHSTIRQTAIFEPRGLAGLLYLYGLYLIHNAIFGGMLRRIAPPIALRTLLEAIVQRIGNVLQRHRGHGSSMAKWNQYGIHQEPKASAIR
jgi:hypothetical protein